MMLKFNFFHKVVHNFLSEELHSRNNVLVKQYAMPPEHKYIFVLLYQRWMHDEVDYTFLLLSIITCEPHLSYIFK